MKRRYPHYTNNNWLPLKWDNKNHKFHAQSERGDKSAEGRNTSLSSSPRFGYLPGRVCCNASTKVKSSIARRLLSI